MLGVIPEKRASRIVMGMVLFLGLGGMSFDTSGVGILFPSGTESEVPVTDRGLNVINTTMNPNSLFAVSGYVCGRSQLPEPVRVKEQLTLPHKQYVGAVVYLNGWQLEFLDEESQIESLFAQVGDASISGNTLSFTARGLINNEDDDQGISACIHYVALAWTNYMPDAFVVQQPLDDYSVWFDGGRIGGVFNFPGMIQGGFANRKNAFVLPTAQGLSWNPDEDYFLQGGYQLGHAERFAVGGYRDYGLQNKDELALLAKPDSQSAFRPDSLTWESAAVFKNGDAADPFNVAEGVVALAGKDFEFAQPHYSLNPAVQVDIASGMQVLHQKNEITGVPYCFAVPVLQGWQLRLHIDDEQVRSIGVWIDEIGFQNGVLSYRRNHVYHDDENSIPSSDVSVGVLGLRQVAPDCQM